MRRGALRAPLLAVAIGVLLAAVGLAGVEAALRAAAPAPEWPRAAGMGIYPGLRTDPLLGPVPEPGWSGTWSALPAPGSEEPPPRFRVSFDDRGMRATGLPRPERPARRILFAGDSVTFGWGVDDSETFVARMDALQREGGAARIDLANAAFPGQSAVAGRHWLRERGLPRDPDLVVLGYGANNAFRFTARPHPERYRLFELREALLQSRLVQLLLARAARASQTRRDPRARETLRGMEPGEWRRVASPDAFEASLRAMVEASRAQGARVLLLAFPRAMQVSSLHGREDAAMTAALQRRRGDPRDGALGVFEVSCVEDRAAPDALARALRASRAWRPTRPRDPRLRELLARGAARFAAGDVAAAEAEFRAALARAPDAPLAHYDLGVAQLAGGRAREGLAHLAEASRLSCSIFLQYAERLWRVAAEEELPVVDVLLLFQAGNARPLFLDAAHLTPRGHDVLARALRPLLEGASVSAVP